MVRGLITDGVYEKCLYRRKPVISSAVITGSRINRQLWRLASAKTAVLEGGGVTETDEGEEAAVWVPETGASFPDDAPAPRLIRFKSARSSAADWQRRSASFSRHFRVTSLRAGGSIGFSSVGG